MKIDARLTFDKVRYDQDTTAHLVLSLTAPALEANLKRPKLCIIPVIDVSPSMTEGNGDKFRYAKRSIEKLIDHLSPGDYCGLVEFSGTARTVQKPIPVTHANKEALKRAVNDLRIGSATNIADALLTGIKLADDMDLPGEVISRVILFTDGQPNRGPAISTADILTLLGKNVETTLASVSAFGYGHDANQDLLAQVAKLAKGNYAFVANPDDALTAFGKELGGLLSSYATNLQIEVTPLNGHEIVEVVSDVVHEEEAIGGDMSIEVPELLMEERRDLVVAVKLKTQKAGGPRSVNVFEVKGGYDVIDPTGHKERKTFEARAKIQFVKDGEQDAKPIVELDEIVSLAQIVHAQLQAEEAAKKGQYAAAASIMRNAADVAGGKGYIHLQSLASKVGSKMGDAHTYAASASYRASTSRGGSRGMGVASYDAEAAQDLGMVGVQLNNSVQASTSSLFSGGASHVGDGTPVAPSVGVGDLNQGILDIMQRASVNVPHGDPLSVSGSALPMGGSAWVAPIQTTVAPQPLPRTNSSEPPKDSKPARDKLTKKKSTRW